VRDPEIARARLALADHERAAVRNREHDEHERLTPSNKLLHGAILLV